MNYLGTTLGEREIKAKFLLEGEDHLDLQMLINEVNNLFMTREPVYVIDSRQKGKRWKVVVNTYTELDYIYRSNGQFEVEFLSPKPFSESVGNTLTPLTLESDKWQIGMNMPSDKELRYNQSNVNTFEIYNAGVHLDPRKLPLKIMFKGSSTNLRIRNLTTGEEFIHRGRTGVNDVIVLDGVKHEKNGISILEETNRKTISLQTGWNKFEVIGGVSFNIIFDFRFYYL